ncbi:hypothetical protein [Gorillibacterium timonense]|uniref:hypothetical protein n=1 Tax=Gorillibacterium timonense TaxID=1689269 RepID=UPI0011DD1B66|nr:hypothetical protein [Gorillibacterium timonense]
MKHTMKRALSGLLVVSLAIAVGFLAGYIASPGILHKNRAATNTNNSSAEALRSKTGEPQKKPAEQQGTAAAAYSHEHPSLMALTLDDTEKEVTARYGKPYSQYVLDDDSDPVTVYDYSQFSVGFDASARVRFVEISGNAADPGLGGLRIGESGTKVLDTLGTPDSNTGYVMTYWTEQTVLKLDIDPESNTIESIKLFDRMDL